MVLRKNEPLECVRYKAHTRPVYSYESKRVILWYMNYVSHVQREFQQKIRTLLKACDIKYTEKYKK